MAAAIVFAAVFVLSFTVVPGLFGNRANQDRVINTGDPDNGATHVAAGIAGGPYSLRPATSGSHWNTAPTTVAPVGAPARWGTYEQVLPDEVLVHNLEHGGIGLHYNCPEQGGCPQLVQQLAGLIPASHSQFILSPYPNMDTRIAVTAWREHLYLDEFDEQAIRNFIEQYIDRAPESIRGNQF